MKNILVKDLLINIDDAIKLLDISGMIFYADKFREKAKILRTLDIFSNEFRKEIKELKNNLVGMGSFDDLPIYPKEGSGISKEEADIKHRNLTIKFGEITNKLLKEIELTTQKSRLKK